MSPGRIRFFIGTAMVTLILIGVASVHARLAPTVSSQSFEDGFPDTLNATTPADFADCIPFGSTTRDPVIRSNTNELTLDRALIALQASCTPHGLATPAGQRIQIFRLGGCWNMSEEQKQALRDQHVDRLWRLGQDRRYETVILDCDPYIIP
jgi:hypothetical protein